MLYRDTYLNTCHDSAAGASSNGVARAIIDSMKVSAILMLTLGSAFAVGCGGPGVPAHNGYKSVKVKPWNKPKSIALNEKYQVKFSGDLDYAAQRRARWYAIQLPSAGNLSLQMEAAPGTDSPDFDLGIEVLDPGFRVVGKADLDDEDAKELTKKRTIAVTEPGRYLVHLYLQGRLDLSDYDVAIDFTPAPGELKTDFPASVAYVSDLAQVPISDDTPADRKPTKVVAARKPRTAREPRPPTEVAPAATTSFSGSILRVGVGASGTEITFSKASGVEVGMKGYIVGVKNGGSFKVLSCTERSCKGVVSAGPDVIGARKVLISP
jgi:hypothetical protein